MAASFARCVLWIGFVDAFASTLPSPVDPRPMYHLIFTLVLAGFSLRTASCFASSEKVVPAQERLV
jgi:hypothetical protein